MCQCQRQRDVAQYEKQPALEVIACNVFAFKIMVIKTDVGNLSGFSQSAALHSDVPAALPMTTGMDPG